MPSPFDPKYLRSQVPPIPSTSDPKHLRSQVPPIPSTSDPKYLRSQAPPIPSTSDARYLRCQVPSMPSASDGKCEGRSAHASCRRAPERIEPMKGLLLRVAHFLDRADEEGSARLDTHQREILRQALQSMRAEIPPMHEGWHAHR